MQLVSPVFEGFTPRFFGCQSIYTRDCRQNLKKRRWPTLYIRRSLVPRRKGEMRLPERTRGCLGRTRPKRPRVRYRQRISPLRLGTRLHPTKVTNPEPAERIKVEQPGRRASTVGWLQGRNPTWESNVGITVESGNETRRQCHSVVVSQNVMGGKSNVVHLKE